MRFSCSVQPNDAHAIRVSVDLHTPYPVQPPQLLHEIVRLIEPYAPADSNLCDGGIADLKSDLPISVEFPNSLVNGLPLERQLPVSPG